MTLTEQQKTDLNNEITADPTAKGYVAFLPDQWWVVIELLNAQTETMPKERMISSRGIASALGLINGENFLKALDDFSVATLAADHPLLPYQPGIKRQVAWLSTQGLDVGDKETRALLDVLAQAGVITSLAATTLKGIALQPASRAEVLGLPYMTNKLFASRQ